MDPHRFVRADDLRGSPGSERGVERLRRNLDVIRRRIEAARARSPRAAKAVSLLLVTKSAPIEALAWLPGLGATDVGENRVAEAESKRASAPTGLTWHGIGHLQTNKVKTATRVFDVFHAVDSVHLAERLEHALAAAGRRWPVYAQVNAARDAKKGGIAPEDAVGFARSLADLPHLDVVGFMTMAREEDEGEAARPTFRALVDVRDDVLRAGVGRGRADGLSMGMSADFEVAVEEGATVVRVGRAAFEGVGAAKTTPEGA